MLVKASPIEEEIAAELDEVWLHPASGHSPYSGANASLFPWTLAKAFLSSPAALLDTVNNRLRTIRDEPAAATEVTALTRLQDLAQQALTADSGKYDALVEYLTSIGVGKGKSMRAVIFAERVATLHWLQKRLMDSFELEEDAVRVLHGQLSDETQQEIVESFKQESSPIRILVTGDVASEGVNLHLQCHQLIHYDIPWSLIRIEQRNGRIDRYGQEHRPQITTLLLDTQTDQFGGDLRVLQRLMEREHEAHKALGDAASLMGKYDVRAEEDAIRKVLAGHRELDSEVREVEEVGSSDSFPDFFASLVQRGDNNSDRLNHTGHTDEPDSVYPDAVSFLEDGLIEVLHTPEKSAPNGVSWKKHSGHSLAELAPPKDLADRLAVLPQGYLAERDVVSKLVLATSKSKAEHDLIQARGDASTSLWPESHYLAPLHPVLDWISDRALASLARNEVFAVRGEGDTHVLLHGTLTNRRGQVVAASFIDAEFPNPANPSFCLSTPVASISEALTELQVARRNTGPIPDAARYEALIGPAMKAAHAQMDQHVQAASEATHARVRDWQARSQSWAREADALISRASLRSRRQDIEEEEELAAEMLPQRVLIRPLLVVVGTEAL